ncbi:MAG: mandelate racemase/muconate lactonizing enzyme family protein [Chloroflexi bacterium]|nr:mandelate racemase/muconate lactonizing enzyme family protein [Chloroflexota bacterium]
MRVTNVRSTIVRVPFSEVKQSSIGSDSATDEVIVLVETDEGITGIGEALATVCPEAIDAAVRQMARFIVGENPFQIEAFSQRVFHGRWQFYRTFGHAAASGIEMALWDIVGKAVDQPVHQLLGGAVRDRIDHFYWIQRKEPAAMSAEARRGREEGFTVFYIKVGIDPRQDIEAVEAVRSGAGPDALLRVDANGAWTPAEAIRIIREMNRYALDFVEQPVSILDLDGLIEVRRASGVPICLDQGALTQWDILNALKRQAADFICAEPARYGGLLEFKKVCSLAELANVVICRHVGPELGILSAAAMQVCATVGNLALGNQTWARLLADDIIAEDLCTFTKGTLPVPKGPGLGVTLDHDKLARYADAYQRGTLVRT